MQCLADIRRYLIYERTIIHLSIEKGGFTAHANANRPTRSKGNTIVMVMVVRIKNVADENLRHSFLVSISQYVYNKLGDLSVGFDTQAFATAKQTLKST